MSVSLKFRTAGNDTSSLPWHSSLTLWPLCTCHRTVVCILHNISSLRDCSAYRHIVACFLIYVNIFDLILTLVGFILLSAWLENKDFHLNVTIQLYIPTVILITNQGSEILRCKLLERGSSHHCEGMPIQIFRHLAVDTQDLAGHPDMYRKQQRSNPSMLDWPRILLKSISWQPLANMESTWIYYDYCRILWELYANCAP